MRTRQLFLFVFLFLPFYGNVFAKSGQPQVMGWIPAYGIEKSLSVLRDNPHIASGLTRLGLQFWNPSEDGKTLVFAPVNQNGERIEPATVKQIVAWARQHKIQVMLTVYNNSQVMKKWDWELARRAFKDHPKEFVASLLLTVDAYELDGVDLDLEGEGNLEQDRRAYASFVKRLSLALKKRQKLLTIDSFHSPCVNAPNMLWWRDWRGHVDAIHSMGYQDLYEGNTHSFTVEGQAACAGGVAIFKYSWQLAFGKNAGYRPEQIVLGMPTWMANWGEGGAGSSILAHLQEVRNQGAGIALWDLQLAAPEWRTVQIWNAVTRLRQPNSER